MRRKLYLRIFGRGLLLYVLVNVLLFIMSMITRSETPFENSWWVGVIIAVAMTFCSGWVSRKMPIETARHALSYGVIWSLMIVVMLLIVTIANGTTGVVFGQWSAYLIFIGIAVGPILWKREVNK